MATTKFGRSGNTLVQDKPGGGKVSFTKTSAGIRAAEHDGGVSRKVDPAMYGVTDVSFSTVGGGNPRATVHREGGEATDFTRRDSGSMDERVHNGSVTRTK